MLERRLRQLLDITFEDGIQNDFAAIGAADCRCEVTVDSFGWWWQTWGYVRFVVG